MVDQLPIRAYNVCVCGSILCCFIEPPVVTAIEVTEVCTNDFTVSWTAASNEGLSYSVTLFPSGMMGDGTTLNSIMDTSHNFTDLTPNTSYDVSVASILNSTCVGIFTTIMVTTLTKEVGVPQSELIVVNMYIPLKYLCSILLCIVNLEAFQVIVQVGCYQLHDKCSQSQRREDGSIVSHRNTIYIVGIDIFRNYGD